MNRRAHPFDLITALIALLIAALAAWVWIAGPIGPLPMHFNLAGEVDRWGDRRELAAVIALMALLCGALAGGMGWAAARAAEPARSRALRAGQAVTVLTLAGTTALIAVVSLRGGGGQPPGPGLLMGGVSALILVIGAFLGRVGPNPFVGVRTPWAYKSRLAWDRSNRLAGRLFLILGLVGLVAAPFAPQPAGGAALIIGLIVAAAWSVIESWRVWRDDPDRQPF